jgi:FkbM family methyltransferase
MTQRHPADMTRRGPKHWLKNLLRRFGYDLVRAGVPDPRPLNLLELAVTARLADPAPFYFVQIGANDGVRSDPLRPLILKHALPGLLIEPLPDYFDALRRNYADQTDLVFEQTAIGASEGTLELARFKPDAPIHDDMHGLASSDTTRMERFARERGLDSHLEKVSVPCTRLGALMKKHAIAAIDLLQIDVEGHEYVILRDIFGEGIFPGIIHYEFLHLTPADRIAAEKLLLDHGYAYGYASIDVLAIREA